MRPLPLKGSRPRADALQVPLFPAAIPSDRGLSPDAAAESVLVVDDDPAMVRLLLGLLTRHGYPCAAAENVVEARDALARQPFGVMLCDVRLPGASGLELVREVAVQHADVASVMVTGIDDHAFAREALRAGAHGYVVKPFRRTELLVAVEAALRARKQAQRNRQRRSRLEETVAERTQQLRAMAEALSQTTGDLRRSHEEAVHRLLRAVESRDREVGAHVERMGELCARIAGRLGVPEHDCDLLRLAASMHDVGKIAVPDAILMKPDRLTPQERAEIERHAEVGHDILSGSGIEILDLAATVAWTHHERVDGRGYPRGLRGEAIPLEGRIAAVADVFDALTSDRPYRPALDRGDALRLMREGRGSQFDPLVFDALEAVLCAEEARAA